MGWRREKYEIKAWDWGRAKQREDNHSAKERTIIALKRALYIVIVKIYKDIYTFFLPNW